MSDDVVVSQGALEIGGPGVMFPGPTDEDGAILDSEGNPVGPRFYVSQGAILQDSRYGAILP